jgi:hypothetical protein
MLDAESGEQIWVDTNSIAVRDRYMNYWQNRKKTSEELLKKHGVDFVEIATNSDYVKPLMQLFKKRA